MVLTDRMQKIADRVPKDCVCADIGTDHGYIPYWLYTNHITEKLILCDVAEGPLSKARENCASLGLPPEAFRLGSGLATLAEGEADCLIFAGMGGELIVSLLQEEISKARAAKKMILQPRTRSAALRHFLENLQLPVTEELLVTEAGRICEILVVEPGAKQGPVYKNEADYEISPLLFSAKDPLLPAYLDHRIQAERIIANNIRQAKVDAAESLQYHDQLLQSFMFMRSLL